MQFNEQGETRDQECNAPKYGDTDGACPQASRHVFDEITNYIKREVGKKGPGVFILPGLLKVKRVEKPATKARQGRNPQTGEVITIKAKPKRVVIKAMPLKALKEMVM